MEIKGKVVFPEGLDTIYVNGAFGGINNHGEIVINFFKDLNTRIESVNVVIEEGKLPRDMFPSAEGFVRNVKSSILLTPDTAKGLANWLLDLVKQLEKAQQNGGNIS